jgi:hypothetical protein
MPSERDREARRLAAFASIAASLAHSEDLDRALPQALRATLDALRLEAGGIYLLDEARGGCGPRSTTSACPRTCRTRSSASGGARPSWGERSIPCARSSWRTSPPPSTRARPRVEAGLRSNVLVPLYARGRAVGMMPVGGYAVREFAEDEIELLAAVGACWARPSTTPASCAARRRHLAQVQALWEIDKAIVEDASSPRSSGRSRARPRGCPAAKR